MNRPFHVFIADDEYQSRLVIIKMLERYFPDIEVTGQAGSVDEAVTGITSLQPQLLFLDVRMNGETGFDILDRLPHTNFYVIFTTAYQEYAVKAFRYSALDYLVKPIDPEELQMAVQKAVSRFQETQLSPEQQMTGQSATGQHSPGQHNSGQPTTRKFTDKIGVPTPEGLLFLAAQDIIYCQAQSNYTELFLTDGQKITSSYTLKSFEDLLSDQHFFRTHKSFLINLRHIDVYRKGEGGVVVMSNGREIEVARRNKAGFLNLFKG
jgi:two-component system LytT family response regulator